MMIEFCSYNAIIPAVRQPSWSGYRIFTTEISACRSSSAWRPRRSIDSHTHLRHVALPDSDCGNV